MSVAQAPSVVCVTAALAYPQLLTVRGSSVGVSVCGHDGSQAGGKAELSPHFPPQGPSLSHLGCKQRPRCCSASHPHQNPLGDLPTHLLTHPKGADSVGLGWGLRICVPTMFPGTML